LGKIRFGVFLPFHAFETKGEFPLSYFDEVRNVVLECERLGYHSVWLGDHLMFGKRSILESWTTLSGIGAGVQKDEHIAYGIPFSNPSIRIDHMKEAVEIIRTMWTQEKASYKGKYYRIKEAVCEPKPLQKPHPPITIGGSGEKLTLKVTAHYADRFDWAYLPLPLYKHKLSVLENHCKTVGRDFQEIEKSCWPSGQIFIAQGRKELDEKLSLKKPKNVTLKDFMKSNLVGTPDDCIQRIQQYANAGATHFMLAFGDIPNLDGARVFAKTVAKTLKSAKSEKNAEKC
jgi:alkanesulfonate monooxygenase SsuD/methylene tetrahydromethanopterin reductase-like flavin-dependent oxidoreductase (luciferase family)